MIISFNLCRESSCNREFEVIRRRINELHLWQRLILLLYPILNNCMMFFPKIPEIVFKICYII